MHCKMRIGVIKTDPRTLCGRDFFSASLVQIQIADFSHSGGLAPKHWRFSPSWRERNHQPRRHKAEEQSRRRQGEKQKVQPYHNEAESASFRASARSCCRQTHPETALCLSWGKRRKGEYKIAKSSEPGVLWSGREEVHTVWCCSTLAAAMLAELLRLFLPNMANKTTPDTCWSPLKTNHLPGLSIVLQGITELLPKPYFLHMESLQCCSFVVTVPCSSNVDLL